MMRGRRFWPAAMSVWLVAAVATTAFAFQPILDTRVEYAGAPDPSAIAIADLNGDGAREVIVASLSKGEVAVLVNNGNGSFAEPVEQLVGNGPISRRRFGP